MDIDIFSYRDFQQNAKVYWIHAKLLHKFG